MKDPEFIKLKNRFLFGIGICLLFLLPFFFFFLNKFTIKDSIIIQRIKNKETFIVFVSKNNCSQCKNYERKLQEEEIPYLLSNIDKDKDYTKMLEYLNLSKEDLSFPSLIYIEEGVLVSTLVDFREEEFFSFISNYKELSINE